MKKKRDTKHPFTVLELLIAMSLLSIMVYSLTLLMNQSQRAMSLGVGKMDAFEELRLALDQMENDLNSINISSWEKHPDNLDENGKIITPAFTTSGSDSFTVYANRPGVIPQLCKITYSLKQGGEELPQLYVTMENLTFPGSPKKEDVILQNVMDFHIFTLPPKDGKLAARTPWYPSMVILELAVLDSDTVSLGRADVSRPEKISESKIKNAIGQDAYQKRWRRLVRAVTLDLSIL